MDKEVKKVIKKLLWLDTILDSANSMGSVFDDVEDELEEMLGSSRGKNIRFLDWLKRDENDDEDL